MRRLTASVSSLKVVPGCARNVSSIACRTVSYLLLSIWTPCFPAGCSVMIFSLKLSSGTAAT